MACAALLAAAASACFAQAAYEIQVYPSLTVPRNETFVELHSNATKLVAGGFEYYGDIGPVENPLPASRAQHQLGPALDLTFSEVWEFNAGALFGLTRATDALVLKVIVGRRL